MRLRLIIKLGTVVSVVLFALAIGYYTFTKLEVTNREREVDLFSLVPSDCIRVLECDDVYGNLDEYSMLDYGDNLAEFQFPGLSGFILQKWALLSNEGVHGNENQISSLVVSFHNLTSLDEQVVFLKSNVSGKQLMKDLLQRFPFGAFVSKEEEYRDQKIEIYPLGNEKFLASYSDVGFLVLSYQKRLIERVIDAHLDGTSLRKDSVFSQMLKKKKTKMPFTLYGDSSSVPFLDLETGCWSQFDCQMNSDVFYWTGNIFLPDSVNGVEGVNDCFRKMTILKEENLLVSADRDSTVSFTNKAYDANEGGSRTLFNECVANLSHEADFVLVVDMQKVEENPERFTEYLPRFILDNVHLLRKFILSVQVTLNGGKISQMWVFTYKD